MMANKPTAALASAQLSDEQLVVQFSCSDIRIPQVSFNYIKSGAHYNQATEKM